MTEHSQLIRAAAFARENAHPPYSGFKVGAALEDSSGRIHTGCNIEISSYSLTICAERTAIFKAISEGARGFMAIAIISDSPSYISPCGACRQVISDLLGDVDVIMAASGGTAAKYKMKELLPVPFGDFVLKELTRK